MRLDWELSCSACGATREAVGLATVCERCRQPWLVRYPDRRRPDLAAWERLPQGDGMWRYRPFLPLAEGEEPVTLGEGETPLLRAPRIAARLGLRDLWVKDEAANPTGSFKARGLSAAVTRAVYAGTVRFVIPTAGNAGVAAAAYAARAGAAVRVYAPRDTPPAILAQIRAFGGDLVVLDGHIGDCGMAARAWAAESGAFDLSTLREPYRIEGKKTLGLELARQLGWRLPRAVIYPTGGGTGLIGMWKAFSELREAGWVRDSPPRMFSVQSSGCAPIVRAFEAGQRFAEPFPEAHTIASGLRVPAAVGDFMILDAVRASGGCAVAGREESIPGWMQRVAGREGIGICPETAVCFDCLEQLLAAGQIRPDEEVVVFNTGAAQKYPETVSLNLPRIDKEGRHHEHLFPDCRAPGAR